jgi:hypothetical protein
MAGATFKVKKKPPPAREQIQVYRVEVRKQLKRRYIPAFLGKLRDVVANWSKKTKTIFGSNVVLSIFKGIAVEFLSKGAKRRRLVWMWVDKTGTKPHKIKKKKKPKLRFRGDYQSKTKPNPPRHGGPGKATGGWFSVDEVNHPGFPPRNFTPEIADETEPLFLADVKAGGTVGINKAKRKGRVKN